MEGYVYGLIDPRDDEIKYIGQTKFNLDKRYKEHLRNCKYTQTKNHNVYRWINELLEINQIPIIGVIEKVEFLKLDEREKYWINMYSKTIKNMTIGGTGIKYKKKRSFSKEHRKKIGDSCRGAKHYNYNKPAHNIKAIYQFDLNSCQLLNEYKSINEAVLKTSISQPSISLCLTGKRNTGGGYIWIYKDVYDDDGLTINNRQKMAFEHPSNKYKSKSVEKIDVKTNKIITTYKSIKEAARENNTSHSAIFYSCNKIKTHIYRNYKWKSYGKS